MRRTSLFLALLPIAALVALSACGGDDGPTGPGGGGNNGGGVPEDPAGLVQSEGTYLANEILQLLPDWGTGNLTPPEKRRTAKQDEAVWVPGLNAWILDITRDSSVPPWTVTRNWTITVRFLVGETPQREFEGAERVNVELSYIYDAQRFEDEDNRAGKSLNMTATLDITGLGSEELAMSGSGSGEIFCDRTVDGEYDYEYAEPGLDLNVTMPPGGCPTGTAVLSMDTDLFSMGFDGTSTVWWTWTQGEQGSIRGSTAFECEG